GGGVGRGVGEGVTIGVEVGVSMGVSVGVEVGIEVDVGTGVGVGAQGTRSAGIGSVEVVPGRKGPILWGGDSKQVCPVASRTVKVTDSRTPDGTGMGSVSATVLLEVKGIGVMELKLPPNSWRVTTISVICAESICSTIKSGSFRARLMATSPSDGEGVEVFCSQPDRRDPAIIPNTTMSTKRCVKGVVVDI
ncbi:MAG: hypothetical protein L0Y56_16165, partial [Nitrospira sp.]|nr:hypothetical protein [Nitrospira sp.]